MRCFDEGHAVFCRLKRSGRVAGGFRSDAGVDRGVGERFAEVARKGGGGHGVVEKWGGLREAVFLEPAVGFVGEGADDAASLQEMTQGPLKPSGNAGVTELFCVGGSAQRAFYESF